MLNSTLFSGEYLTDWVKRLTVEVKPKYFPSDRGGAYMSDIN
jgi:hypothetical protein